METNEVYELKPFTYYPGINDSNFNSVTKQVEEYVKNANTVSELETTNKWSVGKTTNLANLVFEVPGTFYYKGNNYSMTVQTAKGYENRGVIFYTLHKVKERKSKVTENLENVALGVITVLEFRKGRLKRKKGGESKVPDALEQFFDPLCP